MSKPVFDPNPQRLVGHTLPVNDLPQTDPSTRLAKLALSSLAPETTTPLKKCRVSAQDSTQQCEDLMVLQYSQNELVPQHGTLTSLDQMIKKYEDDLKLLDHPLIRAIRLKDLAEKLRGRNNPPDPRNGVWSDLDLAIETINQALLLPHANPQLYVQLFNDLGICLFKRQRTLDDIHRALSAFEKALELSSLLQNTNQLLIGEVALSMGKTYFARHRLTGNRANIDLFIFKTYVVSKFFKNIKEPLAVELFKRLGANIMLGFIVKNSPEFPLGVPPNERVDDQVRITAFNEMKAFLAKMG
jgi:tetratricopeptide (TPR) repeat protein